MPVPKPVLALAMLLPVTAEAGGLLAGVTPCDVKRVAALYGTTEGGAKKQLKAMGKAGMVIDTEYGPMRDKVYYTVADARKMAANCTFEEAGFSSNDADVLATFWGVDPATARSMAEQKVAMGQGQYVDWALQDASKAEYMGGKVYDQDPDMAAANAFWDSGKYSYCDARMVADVWQTDPYGAKVGIGYKILNQDAAAMGALEQTLMEGRQRALVSGQMCDFYETNFTPDDAVRLSEIWHLPIDQAKARVGEMVTRGQEAAVRQTLGR